MSNGKKNRTPPTMTEAHCEMLVERGALEKTGEHEFKTKGNNRYGIAVIRFRPDLPGLPVKEES